MAIRFALLIAAQAAHSVEEYCFRLYDVFAPARAVADAFQLGRPIGFIIANTALVGFGLWCYFARVRFGRGAWGGLAWFWALIETANGIGHLALAAAAGGYFPGLYTAPLLVILSGSLIAELRARSP